MRLACWFPVVVTPLLASSLVAQGVRVGVTGGVVSSRITTTTNLPGLKSLTGFAAGVTASFPIGPSLDLTPELLYITKGGKNDESQGSVAIKPSYVELPLLFRWKFSSSTAIRTFITAGPTLAKLVRCKVVRTGYHAGTTNCQDEQFNQIESTDVGFLGSFGGTDGQVSISIRYEFGLTHIDKANEEKVKNRVLSVMFGYAFGK